MKKSYSYIKTLLMAVVLLAATACEYDISDPNIVPYIITEDNKAIFTPINPETGSAYTSGELAELDYNPKEENTYLEDQTIGFDFVLRLEPVKLEILESNQTTLIKEYTEFQKDGATYKLLINTTLAELGIGEGKSKKMLFKFYYQNPNGGPFIEGMFYTVRFKSPPPKLPTGFELIRKQGENKHILVNNPEVALTVFEANRYGHSYDGNAANYTTVEGDPDLNFRGTSDFSVSFWVRTSSSVSDPAMMGDQDWNSSNNTGFTIAFTGDAWRVAISDGNGNKADASTDGMPFNDGDWHLLAVTFDRDGNMSMYQDGVEVASDDMSAVGSILNDYFIHIGQDGTGTYGVPFVGDIAESKIYDYVLTPAEVAEISKDPSTGATVEMAAGLKKLIQVEKTGDIAMENFGNGLKGYQFNGTNQYATLADDDLGFRYEGDFSISFWVNTTSADSDPVMIGDQDWDSSGNTGLSIAFRGDNWRVAVSDGGGNKADWSTSGDGIPFNGGNWHMLTVTFDRDGNMTMYQDAVAVGGADMSAVGSINSGNPLRMAQDGPATYGQFFEGKMANVVIYDYVLTPENITDLFNN
ncbi:LamG domain-containing protein [Maribellus luteus]|nr:LamG domain-containing protein [Maribellus luteus]